jgi:hypothetical protein
MQTARAITMRLVLMRVLNRYEECLLGYTNPSREVEGNLKFPNKTAGLRVQYRFEAELAWSLPTTNAEQEG